MARTESPFSKPSFLRTFVFVLIAIAAFVFIDAFLEKMERAETQVEAKRYYEAGQGLMKQGLSQAAAEQFRAAGSIVRDNQEYHLALGQALTAAGRFADAETTLSELLQRDATAGPPNLAMARVLVKEGRITEAFSYYHRAIYGQWKQNARGNRVQIRFELIDLLVARHAGEGLLAELLPLQEEAPDDAATKMKLGRLFVAAGSPARGAALFGDLLRSTPQDPDAYAGLGEADFAQGNYRTAASHFRTALNFRPDDDKTRNRLDVCNQVLALDPTQRGLSLEEQYRRSVKLLDLVLSDLRSCSEAASVGAAQDSIDSATKVLKQRVLRSQQGAAYESNLNLADQLWRVRKSVCGEPAGTADEPLSVVLSRVAQ